MHKKDAQEIRRDTDRHSRDCLSEENCELFDLPIELEAPKRRQKVYKEEEEEEEEFLQKRLAPKDLHHAGAPKLWQLFSGAFSLSVSLALLACLPKSKRPKRANWAPLLPLFHLCSSGASEKTVVFN